MIGDAAAVAAADSGHHYVMPRFIDYTAVSLVKYTIISAAPLC